MRAIEFTADRPGDWAFHCHKSHHTMNAMGHQVPNLIGVPQKDLAQRIGKLVPDYMAMGSTGGAMGGMEMPLPDNTLPMMTGTGPFGPLEMGGMFTVLKVRQGLGRNDYRDPGWFRHPKGTVATNTPANCRTAERRPTVASGGRAVRPPVSFHSLWMEQA